MAAATSIWPWWPRRVWISARVGAVEPMMASVDIAAVTTAARAQAMARNSPIRPSAVENCVPLISASPSLAPSVTGASPARASASAPGRRSPPTRASPWPIITAAMCASGARSPEAPTLPCSGITGVTPRASIASISSTMTGRTPEAPRPSDSSFSAIISRTAGASSAGPTPQQCDRIRFLCSVAVSSGAMRTEASLPKPVFTP